MKKLIKKTFLPALILLISASAAFSQKTDIDAGFRGQTIDTLLQLLKDKYAYPEIALKMEKALLEKQKRGDYETISDGEQFAARLTADLREVFDDKHLKISFSPTPIPLRSGKAGNPSPEEIEQARKRQSRENFGLVKIEILKGNVGLIKLNYFAPLDWSAGVYPAAFAAVANTDALIIDIRDNGGSMDIDAIPYFCSFLFDRPVPIGDIFSRETNETRQLWTYAQVPGKKYLDKPVYLLTSNRTASGAEGFVQHLKNLKRAASVGETTRGATMPGMSHRVNEHFSVWISTGRASGGKSENENKGIAPDFPAAPENALDEAHRRALENLLQNTKDENWKEQLLKIQTTLK